MIYVVSTIVVLGLLIFVHELGHFLMAKLVGVRVERFSLGFPPKMIGKKIGETEYMISWVPLGGYVKMFGEHPDEVGSVPPEEQPRSFSHKPTWARFLIVFAGPAFNLVFTVVVLWAMFWANGIERSSTMIGRVSDNSPAAEAGLTTGDRITAIDGERITEFSQIQKKVAEAEGRTLVLTVERADRVLTVKLAPRKVQAETIFGDSEDVFRIGISTYLSSGVGMVQKGSPAEEAGIMVGDRITAIDGKPVGDWYDVVEHLQAAAGVPVAMTLVRNGQTIEITLTPLMETVQNAQGEFFQVPIIGLHSQAEIERIGPITAAYYAWEKTVFWADMTVTSLVKLFQRKVSVKTLGGPLFIAELAGKRAKAGIVELIYLAAFISLNLGFLNLLPIPVLDGGHLFFFVLEGAFRRPISIRIRERAQQVGMIMLLALMAFIFYNDIARIVTRWNHNSNGPAVEETRDGRTQ